MKLTPFAKLVVVVAVAVAALFAVKRLAPDLYQKFIPQAKVQTSAVPLKADLPDATPADGAASAKAVNVQIPGRDPGCSDKPEVRMLLWAWNAQMGAMFANGGPQATEGSLMCKRGVNMRYVREDDSGKMQESLVTFATELSKGNSNPTKGAHFVAIMGDGSATFLKGLNDTLRRLGPEYTAKVIGSAGYSRGEDKFMGPAEWKSTPGASRGGVVSGVLRDGDWNIAQKWLGDNGLCNNPDEHTWDSQCLNWVAASDYIDAAEKYVAGYCEERPVVSNGRRTGETKRICVNGVVTWTPGDVTVAQKRGGLVSIVSTHEYSSQMPQVIIGIDKWMKQNRATVEGMLAAITEGGEAVRGNAKALDYASATSAEVYHEGGTDKDYWKKYYKGVTETDKKGVTVELGGSSANTLADNLLLFGMVPGSSNLFAATYRVFGNIVANQYPSLVPSIMPVDQILDTSYLKAVAERSGGDVTAAKPQYAASSQSMRNVVSRKAWHINFDSGKASFTPAATHDLQQLEQDLLIAGGTVVEIHGHTDSLGSPQANQNLSEERAFAVKQWLEEQSPVNFPEGRVRVFAHGSENPLAPNSTADGRAKNRRVEIVLGTTAK